MLTFVPKNLFEQFHRACNIYFLLLVLLQLYVFVFSWPASSSGHFLPSREARP